MSRQLPVAGRCSLDEAATYRGIKLLVKLQWEVASPHQLHSPQDRGHARDLPIEDKADTFVLQGSAMYILQFNPILCEAFLPGQAVRVLPKGKEIPDPSGLCKRWV